MSDGDPGKGFVLERLYLCYEQNKGKGTKIGGIIPEQ